MMIRVDTTSFVPIFEQIKTDIRRRIAQGVLPPGEPLPSIRELASRLVVNPNTVARAYRELEQEGLIKTRQGKGCFVSDGSPALVRETKRDVLNRIISRALGEAESVGFSADEIGTALEKILKDRRGRNKGGQP